jgi:hypothetical protein
MLVSLKYEIGRFLDTDSYFYRQISAADVDNFASLIRRPRA